MIRSKIAITRLIVVPYGVLLLLYLAVVGGGGMWLYLEVRAVETRLQIDELMTAIEPLAEKLGGIDALGSMRRNEPWLLAEVKDLFDAIPSLRTVSVRGLDAGFQIKEGDTREFSARVTASLPPGTRRADSNATAEKRLHEGSDLLFLIAFDLTDESTPLVRLDFGFDRAALLDRIDAGLLRIRQAVVGFGVVGGISIVLAVFISIMAMRATRGVEGYFQEVHQRAAITEMAAALVHDLRNPLAALRANVKALLVSPGQTREIADELDRDIVMLNSKLTAFLDLTRHEDSGFASVDVSELIDDAVRIATPVLAEQNLGIITDIAPNVTRATLHGEAMRDALLNIIINAAQSGQKNGDVRVSARMANGALEIAVEDHGAGIREQDLPRLFDAFYTTRAGGNGLGLAIVQSIVAAHDGQVSAENLAQGGARFVVTVPLQRKETPRWWEKLKKNYPA